MKAIILMFALLTTVSVYAQSATDDSEEREMKLPPTFPVIVDWPSELVTGDEGQVFYKGKRYLDSTKFNDPIFANTKEFIQTVNDIKAIACAAIDTGNIKIYLSFDIEAKVWGVGGSMGSGIEISFLCDQGEAVRLTTH